MATNDELEAALKGILVRAQGFNNSPMDVKDLVADIARVAKNALTDGRSMLPSSAKTGPMSERKFHRYLFQFEVLVEARLPGNTVVLSKLGELASGRAAVGALKSVLHEENVPANRVVHLLSRHESGPALFDLTGDGSDLYMK